MLLSARECARSGLQGWKRYILPEGLWSHFFLTHISSPTSCQALISVCSSLLVLFLTSYLMGKGLERGSPLCCSLCPVLSSVWCYFLPSSSDVDPSLPKLFSVPCAANKTPCLFLPTSGHEGIYKPLNLLLFWNSWSSCPEQERGYNSKSTFSFLHCPTPCLSTPAPPWCIHLRPRLITPLSYLNHPSPSSWPLSILGLGKTGLTKNTFQFLFSALICLCLVFKEYFKILINANTVVRRELHSSPFSPSDTTVTAAWEWSIECFREAASERVGEDWRNFRPVHSFVL